MDIETIRTLTPLEPLPSRVYFVCRHLDRWADVLRGDDQVPESLDADPDRVVTHEDMTIVQTFVNLRRSGLAVRLVDRARPEALNVVSSIDLQISDHTSQAFIVAFRGDWARPELSDLTLTMNATVATRPTEYAMPHWIQTGLVPRDPSRGDRLERLVFKGDLVNLDPRFGTDRFRDELASMGVEFATQPYVHETKSSGWHDYSDVDAVLAIRAIHPTELSTKPASKLINAWAAGVPAILGNEPAFRELRRDPLDYVEVSSPEEAIAAVRRLKESPADYRAMVEHGTTRAQDYTNRRVAERWHDFLSGPAETAYRSWLTQDRRRREAAFAVRAVRQKISLFSFKRQQSTR
ncbi:MAG: glycosyltransferase [Acidimicrobiales bacterium]